MKSDFEKRGTGWNQNPCRIGTGRNPLQRSIGTERCGMDNLTKSIDNNKLTELTWKQGRRRYQRRGGGSVPPFSDEAKDRRRVEHHGFS